MAMLAEGKQKQKWSLNPRGTAWSKDENKFGQKLMEKMGWSKGKGLGRDEQGSTENVKVHLKDDNKGMGYKNRDDQWINHYDAFEDVLSALNSGNNSNSNSGVNSANNSDMETNVKNESLESLTKKSRARLHYHKFTRGKDTSQYNADDLACILGSKKSKRNLKIDVEETKLPKKDEVDHVENNNGVTTIKGGNIKEYFAQKMSMLKKKRELKATSDSTEDYVDNNHEIVDEYTQEQYLYANNDNEIVNEQIDGSNETKRKNKKKKKQKKECIENNNAEDLDLTETSTEKSTLDVNGEINEKKIKKSKKKHINDHSNSHLVNETTDKLLDKKLKKHSEKDIVENIHYSSKEIALNDCDSNNSAVPTLEMKKCINNINGINENTSNKNKKKKSKHRDLNSDKKSNSVQYEEHNINGQKECSTVERNNCELIVLDDELIVDNEDSSVPRKKKRKHCAEEIDESSVSRKKTKKDSVMECDDSGSPRNKKNKKHSIAEDDSGVPKRKKSKKHSVDIEFMGEFKGNDSMENLGTSKLSNPINKKRIKS